MAAIFSFYFKLSTHYRSRKLKRTLWWKRNFYILIHKWDECNKWKFKSVVQQSFCFFDEYAFQLGPTRYIWNTIGLYVWSFRTLIHNVNRRTGQKVMTKSHLHLVSIKPYYAPKVEFIYYIYTFRTLLSPMIKDSKFERRKTVSWADQKHILTKRIEI